MKIQGYGTTNSGSSFGQQAHGPQILVANGAYPGIYIASFGSGTNFSNLEITSFGGNGTNGNLQVFDAGFFSSFDYVNWRHNTPGPLSLSMVIDSPGTGFSYKFDHNAFDGGCDIGSCSLGLAPIPSMVITGAGQPAASSGLLNVSKSWFINKGGFAIEQTNPQGGSSWIFTDVATESQVFPPISFSGPSLSQTAIGNQLYIENIFSADTPISQVAVFGANLTNASYISGNGPTNQRPWNTGGVFIGLTQTGGINTPQSVFAEEQISTTAIDGVFNQTTSGPMSLKRFSEPVSLSPGAGIFTNQLTTVAPTCSVSAGGALPIASYTFLYAPIWWNGGEGFRSPQSTVCTTTGGNQTITVNWTLIPGVKGYNLYRCVGGNCFIQVFILSGTTTSAVVTAIGGSNPPPLTPAGGPSAMLGASIGTQNLLLGAGNSGGVLTENVPTLTANRTQTRPDAAGQVVLDSTLTRLSQFTGFDYSATQGLRSAAYDTFNRANGGLGANWTAGTGSAYSIASNQVTTTSGNQNALYTGSTFNADHFAEVMVIPASAGFTSFGPSVRAASNGNGYTCYLGNGGLRIFKLVAGNTSTSIASSGFTPVTSNVKLEVIGTTLNCYLNGVLTLTGTDSSYSTGSPGLASTANGTNQASVDDFNAGNVNSLPRQNNEQNWTLPQHFNTLTVGQFARSAGALSPGLYLGPRGPITSASGNSGRAAQSSGAMTQTKLKTADANGNIVDTAGSGTLGITFPSRMFIRFALCNNGTAALATDTTAASTVGCFGTTTKVGVWQAQDADVVTFSVPLATDFTGAIDGRLYFNSPDTTGTAIFNIALACVDGSGATADDPAYNASSAFGTITLATPANASWVSTVTGITQSGTTTCAAGNWLNGKITRATDTATSRVNVKGLELTVRRAL